jgi:enamine deaminase RidA (YjgF/YER057c/UK114 family)
MEVENKLKALGLELPAPSPAPPGRAGAVKVGNILFVGGHTPGQTYVGKLGAGFSVEQGYEGARQACLNCLADVKAVIGDLDRVKRVAKLLCMVNSAPDFGRQPQVANGATDLLRQLYGDAGAHARSAVGMAALPNGACIEIEMIMEVED